tara:strand:- start:8639 stop:9109 length:471 start_codon:yes stop_codon:yes gene_type:complete
MTIKDIFEEALDIASKLTHVSKGSILKKSRKRNIVDARKLSVYYMRSKYSLNWTETSRMFDMSHASIIHMYKTFLNESKFDKLSRYYKLEIDSLDKSDSMILRNKLLNVMKRYKESHSARLDEIINILLNEKRDIPCNCSLQVEDSKICKGSGEAS